MSGAKIKLNNTPASGELNADASGFNALVTLPLVPEQSGYVRPLSEVDAGRVTGSPYLVAGEVSEDFRTRVELDTILDTYVFNSTAQDTGKHTYYNTTMTNTWAGNALNTNASGITTLNTATSFRTQQTFPNFGAAETLSYISVAFTGTWAVTNKTQEIGIGNCATTLPYAATDGCYIRVNSSGLMGVANFNGSEQVTPVWKVASGGIDFVPVIGTVYDIIVATGRNLAVFWMDLQDGLGYTRMASLTSATGAGMVTSTGTAPFFIRESIGGTAASAVSGMRLVAYTITQGGFTNTRSEITTAAIITGGQQGQQGHTQGTTALYTNSLAAGAGAAMSNSAANLGVGLGGQFSALPTLAVNTDGIICSYQNPVATTAINGKQLVITGVKVDGIVTTVLVGNATPVAYVICLNYGHTNVSLATSEAATTKIRRVIPIGTMTFAAAAAVGTTSSTGYFTFTRPIPVNPGEFVSISAKNLGAVTSTGVITFIVGYDYGWII